MSRVRAAQVSRRAPQIKPLRLVLLTFGAVAIAGASPSPVRAENSPELNACMDYVDDHLPPSGSRWSGVRACLDEEIARQDKKLNTLYSALKSASAKFGPKTVEVLVSGQRQWMSYQDQWCAFEGGHPTAPFPNIAERLCRVDLIKAQAERLSEQLDDVVHQDPE